MYVIQTKVFWNTFVLTLLLNVTQQIKLQIHKAHLHQTRP